MNKIPFAEFPRLVVTAPPRWGKTTQLLEYIATFPVRSRIAYVTYSKTVSEARLEDEAGPIKARVTPAGIDTNLNGGFDLIVVDEPYKHYQDARNPRVLDAVSKQVFHMAMTRLAKDGQMIVAGSRCCKADIFGQLGALPSWVSMKIGMELPKEMEGEIADVDRDSIFYGTPTA